MRQAQLIAIAAGAILAATAAWPQSNEESVFQIHPLRPVNELRLEAMRAKPPAEEGHFRKPDLVELVKLDSSIHLDIRYATNRNFMGTAMYSEARAFLERPAARAMLAAGRDLKEEGYGFLIHDAYRPWFVTRMFWDATPSTLHTFVADPSKGSKHNRGCAVDLSIYYLASGKPVEMPSGYDEMTERAHPGYTGGTAEERRHRDQLRKAMEAHGFTVDPGEWWHFDFKDWREYPIINKMFEQLPVSR